MTASQTAGPFFDIGLSWLYRGELGQSVDAAERLEVTGRVLDGAGQPVIDALLEIWQADASGNYPDEARPALQAASFARVAVDAEGSFRFSTSKPGSVSGQAPHLSVRVFMRGLLKPACTRLYFPADPRNEQDPVLSLVPAGRRATLIARAGNDGELSWDVRMQGEAETVFFDF